MRLRTYTVSQKYVKNKHGDIGFYKKRIKKWIKSSQPYKSRKRGLQKLLIHSTRFGFLNLYNRKEQQELICPSGYSISQCFNVLRKLWYAYRRAIGTDKDIDKMKKYAKAVQDVQKDMGIKTASFPHLGLYGDALILNAKNGKSRVSENYSKKEKRGEYEKCQMENSIKIQESLKPDILNGEAIVTLVDDVSPYEKHDSEITVPLLLKPEDEKEEILSLVDNVPFQRQRGGPRKSKGFFPLDYVPFRKRRIGPRKRNCEGESTISNADDEISNEIDTEIEDTVTVSSTLEPEGDEEIFVLSDDIPFRS